MKHESLTINRRGLFATVAGATLATASTKGRASSETIKGHIKQSIVSWACSSMGDMTIQKLLCLVRMNVGCVSMAKRCRAKVLQASTSEIYGDPEVHPQPENYRGSVNPIGIRACYDEGKRAAETLFMDYHRAHGVNIRLIRIFNTYGPRMHPYDGRVVSNFIRQALTNVDITIYGDGSQTRSFCYRDDLIEGMIAMMNGSDNFIGPVNLGIPSRIHNTSTRRNNYKTYKIKIKNYKKTACQQMTLCEDNQISHSRSKNFLGNRTFL